MPEIGQTLSHFRIMEKIGEGGMGTVFLAEDLTLDRKVALKFLPEAFTSDPERMARFEREAKLLASLNHPNIAGIYGLEQADGSRFLVLEYVEGETLQARLSKGALQLEDALELCRQIAEGLEAAHEKGVIHRDLKPANVMITAEEKVKILDFGLAKAFSDETQSIDSSQSPTLTEAMTQPGVILGTAAYMSPEQAKGKSVDKRADIWAFGCILYECLTGKKAFEGETVTEMLAAVLRGEPDWNRLPSKLHPRISLLLERCLEKHSKDRYGVISDARVDIQKALADPDGMLIQAVTISGSEKKSLLRWIVASIILTAFIVGGSVWILKPIPSPEPMQTVKFDYRLPKEHEFVSTSTPNLAVSPDGSQFAYSTNKGIYLRSINDLNAKLIAGTAEMTEQPFFSQDGKWIGYWSMDDYMLKKIRIEGGTSKELCEGDPSTAYYHWGTDGKIYYAGSQGIMRVSQNGGDPEVVIELNIEKGEAFFSPQLLPDEKSVLFTLDIDNAYKIAVQSLDKDDRKILFDGATAQYLPTGHIVYMEGTDLYAMPFDIDQLKRTGEAVPIVRDILVNGPPHFCISNSGTLVYFENISTPLSLVLVNFEGKEEALTAPPGIYGSPRFSHKGNRIALTISDNSFNFQIGIWNIIRAGMEPLPNNDFRDGWPIWSPDDQKIIFGRERASNLGIFRMSQDGTGTIEELYTEPGRQIYPTSLSSNGDILLCNTAQTAVPNLDIGILQMSEKTDKPEWKLLLEEDYIETSAKISSDDSWLAYTSLESNQPEIYVRSFPELNKVKRRISINGGYDPLWSPNGKELYYRNGDHIMAVTIETEPEFKRGKPLSLFPDKYFSSYLDPSWDIHPAGNRFLMMKDEAIESSGETYQRKIIIVTNWFEELKELVPVP